MERTETMDRERMPETPGVSAEERNLHRTLMSIAGLFAGALPFTMTQLSFISPLERVWLTFLAANVVVWTAVLLIVGVNGLINVVREAKAERLQRGDTPAPAPAANQQAIPQAA